MLKCNIKYGETNRYKWINYSSEQHGDSSRLISYKGDTLVIHYQPKIETINGQESYWAGAELELVLNIGSTGNSRGRGYNRKHFKWRVYESPGV